MRKTETIAGQGTVFWDYVYDPAGRLTSVRKNGAAFHDYKYDGNGNRTLFVDSASGTTTAPVYDAQDRLLTYGTTAYTYTPNGEVHTKTVGGQTTTYLYDVLGNLVEVDLPANVTIKYEVDAERVNAFETAGANILCGERQFGRIEFGQYSEPRDGLGGKA